jgi:hypothetical protein
VDQLKVTVHSTITYPVFRRQRVQILIQSANTKTQSVEVALSGHKNVEVVPYVRWLHYTASTADNPELMVLMIDKCNLCDIRRYASDNNNHHINNNNNNNNNNYYYYYYYYYYYKLMNRSVL